MNKYKNIIQDLLIVMAIVILSISLDINEGIYYYIGEFSGNAIFGFILWSMPFIIIASSTLKEATKQFQKVYFYYAYRLEKRDKFIWRLIIKMIVIVSLLVSIRYIVYFLLYKSSLDISLLIMSYIYMVAFTIALVLSTFAIYQIRKDDSVIAYSIVFYIIYSFISFSSLSGHEWITFINIGWFHIITMIILSVVMCFINIKIINNNYLYD